MTKFKKLATKIILSVLIILSFFLAQNFLLINNFSQTNYNLAEAAQAITEKDAQDVSSKVSNNNFSSTTSGSESTTGSTSILNPSSWTKEGTFNSTNMRAGVITINDESSFKQKVEDYKLADGDYPQGTANTANGNNVLFINSTTTTTYGYKSSDIELDANSYYAVSVKYYTGNAQASFGISSPQFTAKDNTIIKSLDSNKNWATATIYISTSDVQKTTINIMLYLGYPVWTNQDHASPQSGYVFFDDVKLVKLSQPYYQTLITTPVDTYDRISVVDEQKHANITSSYGFVENGSFDNGLTDWTVETTGSSNVGYEETTETNQRVADSKILSILNTKQTESSGYAKSSAITIEQNKLYKFSIWAKTNASSIDFSMQTKDGKINENTISPATINEVSNNTDPTTQNWNEYVFFVRGNSLQNVDVILTVGLKSSNKTSDEYLYVDNITSQLVSTSDLESFSNAGITYSTLALTPSSSLNIANGYFNNISEITLDGTYPLKAENFERVDTNTQNISGIVNLEENIFNSTKIDFGNPSTKPNSYIYEEETTAENVSNNVFVMYNNTNSYQTTKSTSSLTASANTQYVLKVNIFTDISTAPGGANLYLTDGTNVLAQICDINTQKEWGLYKIYFNNYGNEQTLTVQIGFGRENSTVQGFAYFDNLEWNTSSADLTKITQDAKTKVVNLSKSVEHSSKVILTEGFDEYDVDEISETNKLNAPLLWNGEVKATTTDEFDETTTLSDQDITAGVLTQNNSTKVLGSQTVMEDPTNNVLLIKSTSDNFYGFSNNLSYNLTSGSYYRITVKVKTINLSQDSENQKTVDGTVVPYGASISLNGFDENFVGINTNGSFNTVDGWEEFKFYINPDSDIALTLWLCLGSEKGWTSGYALFDDVEVIEMTEDEFTLNLNSDKEDVNLKNHIQSVTTTQTNNEQENNLPNRTYTESLAWLAIPTILIALGIIAAIIGFLIKKYIENRPVKVTVKNNYDRESTLLKDLDHKNYRTSVNHKLKLLREELAQAEQYLKEEQTEHLKQKEAYETAKEIAEQDKSIKLESPDKSYTNYDERIRKLEKNIASIKADIKILEDEQEKLNKKSQKMREKDLKGNEIKVVKKGRKK